MLINYAKKLINKLPQLTYVMELNQLISLYLVTFERIMSNI
jgi:hypothetical protein